MDNQLKDYIFHERQEGQLCAQHCINSLLQGLNYTAVDLAEIAKKLDQKEMQLMNPNSNIKLKNSQNYDDTGYFSVQVVSEALKVFDLELVHLDSEDAIALEAKRNPSGQFAFVCNLQYHWFSIRKFGSVALGMPGLWYNLDSQLQSPSYLSDMHLDALITQCRLQKYTIFLVKRITDPTVGLQPSLADEVYLNQSY